MRNVFPEAGLADGTQLLPIAFFNVAGGNSIFTISTIIVFVFVHVASVAIGMLSRAPEQNRCNLFCKSKRLCAPMHKFNM